MNMHVRTYTSSSGSMIEKIIVVMRYPESVKRENLAGKDARQEKVCSHRIGSQ
jgi:hypothetical protein